MCTCGETPGRELRPCKYIRGEVGEVGWGETGSVHVGDTWRRERRPCKVVGVWPSVGMVLANDLLWSQAKTM